ncbi:MAG: FAD:protein FMN transferase [Gammaproteobacteria bacterium]|nr:MAG: FAD:protein FMN transferase [Gammaproteobacteria bacterium]RLA32983.1 MAG: FAD:protein FMN transferase [Gammaproteobacteria bacterium]
MGSPCELLIETAEESAAKSATDIVANEAWRIEDKFSRYLPDNIVHRINNSDGITIQIDDETANLIDFATSLFEMSDGRFDITSGVLRKAWKFDGGDQLPDGADVRKILKRVGWNKAVWQRPELTLRRGMQIDFGGVGKEYAVDRAAGLLGAADAGACLLNFGGDLVATGPPADSDGWQVGIEAFDAESGRAKRMINLKNGALATSGDARRFILKDGVRYGHILDPTTGWPVANAPRSITIAANTCTQAGMLATLAMLKGEHAEEFLEQQECQFWCFR